MFDISREIVIEIQHDRFASKRGILKRPSSLEAKMWSELGTQRYKHTHECQCILSEPYFDTIESNCYYFNRLKFNVYNFKTVQLKTNQSYSLQIRTDRWDRKVLCCWIPTTLDSSLLAQKVFWLKPALTWDTTYTLVPRQAPIFSIRGYKKLFKWATTYSLLQLEGCASEHHFIQKKISLFWEQKKEIKREKTTFKNKFGF